MHPIDPKLQPITESEEEMEEEERGEGRVIRGHITIVVGEQEPYGEENMLEGKENECSTPRTHQIFGGTPPTILFLHETFYLE